MDPYVVLGITPTASADEIKSAYRRQARALHPDVRRTSEQAAARAHEDFCRLNGAFTEALARLDAARRIPAQPQVVPSTRPSYTPVAAEVVTSTADELMTMVLLPERTGRTWSPAELDRWARVLLPAVRSWLPMARRFAGQVGATGSTMPATTVYVALVRALAEDLETAVVLRDRLPKVLSLLLQDVDPAVRPQLPAVPVLPPRTTPRWNRLVALALTAGVVQAVSQSGWVDRLLLALS